MMIHLRHGIVRCTRTIHLRHTTALMEIIHSNPGIGPLGRLTTLLIVSGVITAFPGSAVHLITTTTVIFGSYAGPAQEEKKEGA